MSMCPPSPPGRGAASTGARPGQAGQAGATLAWSVASPRRGDARRLASGQAIRTGVEGTLRIRCVITSAGTVEACEVLERLPLAEATVLAALQARRYRPAEIEGRAVSVHHLFTIRIRAAH